MRRQIGDRASGPKEQHCPIFEVGAKEKGPAEPGGPTCPQCVAWTANPADCRLGGGDSRSGGGQFFSSATDPIAHGLESPPGRAGQG